MNQHLQTILDFIQQAEHLSAEEKAALLKAAKDADKELEITSFELECTEKVKHTTAILLEETIEELEQKRKAVEAQNRELEIESALERVRSVALAMKGPDDMLDVCRIIATELSKLDVKEIRNVQTAIFYESKGTYINYEYYTKHDKPLATEVRYNDHAMSETFARQMLSGTGGFFIRSLEGKELIDWYEFQKTTNQFADAYLVEAHSLNYYWYSLGPVALGISTYYPLSEDERNLFKRFKNVFELAYRRYLDIEQALAQAKEARIETSLERVRAVAMAMKKSEELTGICEVMYNELTALGFTNIRNAQIAINLHAYQSWLIFEYSDHGAISMKKVHVSDGNVSPLLQEIAMEISKSKDALFQKHITGQEFEDWRTWRIEADGLEDPRVTTAHSMCFYLYAVESGLLGISTFDEISEQQIQTLKRFKNVFELSYRRYTDVAKAEAQAREARIEMALERVRAVAMAMRKHDELALISTTIYKELTSLDFSGLRNTEIIINNDSKETIISYYSDYGVSGVIEIDYKTNLIIQGWANELRKASDAFVEIMIPENEMDAWRKYREEIGYLPDAKLNEAKTVYYYSYSIGLGALSISSFTPITKEQIKILERFRNVFKLSYQRYIDIEQAEAQAREAQIELALERVRARTMAMHSSNEFPEVATLLFEQVKSLGIETYTSGFNIWDKEHKNLISWMSNPRGTLNPPFEMPIHSYEQHKRIYTSWKNHDTFIEDDLKGNDLITHYNFLRSFPLLGEAFRKSEEAGIKTPDRQVHNNAHFSNGYLLFITNDNCPQYHDLFKRFARVFDQTYTRFLDLQKAEAQAREAQIEAALERVRSASLAMHHSDELEKVVVSLFDRLIELGLSFDGAGIYIFEKAKKEIHLWVASKVAEPVKVYLPYDVDIAHNSINEDLWNAIEKGEDIINKSYSGKAKNDYYRYVGKYNGSKIPVSVQEMMIEVESWTASFATEKNSVLVIDSWAGRQTTDEDFQILKRFAKVFEQAYTRFLDLQKAETQAREAEIELALERVRARTMAMQNSDELKQAATLLFQQAKALGVPAYSCGYNIWEIGEKKFTSWMSTQDGTDINGVPDIPLTEDANFISYVESKQKGEPFFVLELRGKRMQEHYQYLKSIPAFKEYFDYAVSVGFDLPETQIHHIANFSQGNLLFITLEPCPDFHDVFKRFAAVFEQTYTRFLDLQKAEAQAKESQIQLALERVRARTMAMQKSDELSETVYILFQQFKELGENPDQATIGIINQEQHVIEYWVTMYGNQMNQVFKFSIDEPHVTKRIYEAWKENKKSLVIDLSGDALMEFMAYRAGKGGAAINPDEKRRIINVAFFSKGLLNVQSNEKRSEESIKLLERFAAVFEQTYTRFLDLQNAEAQARESNIEAALEKVRSRSMGMQKSEELKEVIQVVYEQFVHLKIKIEHTGFVMDYKTRNDHHLWIADPLGVPSQVTVPYFDSVYYNRFNEAKEKGENFFAINLSFDEKNKFYQTLFNYVPGLTEEAKKFYFSCAGLAASTVLLDNVCLYIENFSGIPYTDEENKILMRFGKVFQQAYTRFLDLQKAEAQTRESQIQLALERARAQSMMMQHSTELDDTLRVFHEQVLQLNIPSSFSFLWLPDEEKDRHIFWAAWAENNLFKSKAVEYPLDRTEAATAQCILDWKGNEAVVSYHVPPGGVANYFAVWSELIAGVEQLKPEYFSDGLYYVEAFMKYGCFGVMVKHQLHEDEKKILERFAIEFERAYTRFLDLQKAEVQAREAQIQLALERVRARTMAMHRSEELAETAQVMFYQLLELGGIPDRISIGVVNESDAVVNFWTTDQSGSHINNSFSARLDERTLIAKTYKAWKENKESLVIDLHGDELKEWINFARNEMKITVKEDQIKDRRIHSLAFFTHGWILVTTHVPQATETIRILERFASVFNLTYRRFLDLQKAEAQAREAQIQLALERVRARTMAMQKSEELEESATVLFQQMKLLGFDSGSCGFNIWIKDEKAATVWASSPEGGLQSPFKLPHTESELYKDAFNAMQHGDDVFIKKLSGTNLVKHFDYLLTVPGIGEVIKKLRQTNYNFPERIIFHFVFFKQGYLTFHGHTDDAAATEILKRFAKVFEQTYTRFLDLKKAETQAREAQIEAAMEKVRARAMAMQKPDELVEVAELLRKEMGLLGVEELETSSIYIHHEDTQKTECWYAIQKENKLVSDHMIIELNDTWVGREMLQFYRADKKQTSILMQGDARKAWINYCAKHSNVLVGFYGDKIPDRTYHLYKFSNGYMGAASPGDISAESWNLLQRATSVFSLAYTRFNDLQQAEAQAREAKIETALERVRSRTLAMQRSEELAETAAVLFKQLILLGIEPNRLYINIVKDKNGDAEFWITDEDGSKVSMAYEDNMNNNSTFKKMFDGWREQKKSLVIDMKGKELKEYFNYLSSINVPFKGGLEQERRVQHIAYFSKGFIGMASPDEQPEETILLLERFAGVFNLTFTRFNDLKIAEAHALQAEQDLMALMAAKKKAEDAFTELKTTQKQLIQSEKMASLGELTAGIAHEIQNPLNFVNNFSEVSNELIDEMNEELAKGDIEEAHAIALDIKQNLEKINHHGKRAEGIVKGMLQHSRTSSGQKELTDINVLCDEYLRLSYHGLRAKDKSFNADFKTDFDENIEKINIVPQDIGRVILNLFNNAFYAANEKNKNPVENFKPLVSVKTKKVNDTVEIKVIDNGNGIPQNIVDKIFQPFFTTKPTGQGTGLGLSLSYDIVKAHGGEIKVESREGEGSVFIIMLPA